MCSCVTRPVFADSPQLCFVAMVCMSLVRYGFIDHKFKIDAINIDHLDCLNVHYIAR